MTIDLAKVLHAARNGIPLVIQSATLPPETDVELEAILGLFLKELGQESLKDHLAYCLKELTGNAKKANTKRSYFVDKGWDITDPLAYETGMASFKQETLSDIGRYLELQEKAGLNIRITFLIRQSVLFLGVKNNVAMTPAELGRVHDRISRARSYETMEQAFEQILDDSEGAGLGIVILILMLRKMGLTEKSFTLESAEGATTASLKIPMDAVKLELVTTLADELVQVIDSLPPFPENLRQLMKLLDQPNVGFEDLAARLSIDPALTADLIRYINSAGRGRRARVTNLRDAVQMVGLKGIREMILPYGTQKLLKKFVEPQKVLWGEAQRVSQFASGLAREFGLERQNQDLAQIGGLFSTLGRIIVSYLHPQSSERIEAYCREKHFSAARFNDLTQTINPAELGARVAEKWQFPENLVQVLRHQSWPHSVAPELLQTACIIHLAVNLNAHAQGLTQLDQIHEDVLKTLGVTPARLEKLFSSLSSLP